MMRKILPPAKLSKKAQKEKAKEKRLVWSIDPRPRIVESKKIYNRKKRVHSRFDDYGMNAFPFLLQFFNITQRSIPEQKDVFIRNLCILRGMDPVCVQ